MFTTVMIIIFVAKNTIENSVKTTNTVLSVLSTVTVSTVNVDSVMNKVSNFIFQTTHSQASNNVLNVIRVSYILIIDQVDTKPICVGEHTIVCGL